MDYTNLRNKSVFDFTDDKDILEAVLRFDPSDKESKKLYLEHSHPISLITGIGEYAYLTGNKELEKKVRTTFDEINNEFDEICDNAQENGVLVD